MSNINIYIHIYVFFVYICTYNYCIQINIHMYITCFSMCCSQVRETDGFNAWDIIGLVFFRLMLRQNPQRCMLPANIWQFFWQPKRMKRWGKPVPSTGFKPQGSWILAFGGFTVYPILRHTHSLLLVTVHHVVHSMNIFFDLISISMSPPLLRIVDTAMEEILHQLIDVNIPVFFRVSTVSTNPFGGLSDFAGPSPGCRVPWSLDGWLTAILSWIPGVYRYHGMGFAGKSDTGNPWVWPWNMGGSGKTETNAMIQ